MTSSEVYLRDILPTEYATSTSSLNAFNEPYGSEPHTKSVVRQQAYDYMTLITAISKVYRSGQYVHMPALNDIRQEPLASGRDFQVGRSTLLLTTTSSISDRSSSGKLRSRVVVKKVKTFKQRYPIHSNDIDLFVRELSILHHLRDSANIVRLRGVGWIYDCLDESDLSPCPKPAILLEEATGTLEWLIDTSPDLSALAEMKICRDVANGLLEVHESSLVHGDIKPANVLVFREMVLDAGAEVSHYKCKISDFSAAFALERNKVPRIGGTRLYMAPEVQNSDFIPVQHAQATDVWSLGVLFAQVTERTLDMSKYSENPSGLQLAISQSVNDSIQSSALEPLTAMVRQAIFHHTLQLNPEKRSLIAVIDQLLLLFEQLAPQWNYQSKFSNPVSFKSHNLHDLYISYENFKLVSGQVHDQIVSSLVAISKNEHDLRRAQGLWELAVISLSNFAGPIYSAEEGLSFLRQSAEVGDIRARAMCYRIHKTLVPSFSISTEMLTWLNEAAVHDHVIAIQDLRRLDGIHKGKQKMHTLTKRNGSHATSGKIAKQRFTVMVDNPPPQSGECVNMNALHSPSIPGDFEHAGGQSLRFSPDNDARDLYQDTPLIQASRCGDYPAVSELLQSHSDFSLVNKIGENFMHFAAHFSSTEVKSMISMVSPKQYTDIFLQEAKGVAIEDSRQLFPLPPGTPLERAVYFNEVEIVQILLDSTPAHVPTNGIVMRRALLLALRLQYLKVTDCLLTFVHNTSRSWDHGLSLLCETRWEYKGRKRNLLDAILVGGVSGTGLGADLPLEWWRLCQLGKGHLTAQISLTERILTLSPNDMHKEDMIDAAFSLVMNERFFGSLQTLLEWKARVTDGAQRRLQSLLPLTWNSVQPPTQTGYREFCLRILRSKPFRIFGPWGTLQKDPTNREIVHRNVVSQNRTNYYIPNYCWNWVQSANDVGCLERPEELVNYVDQIFYSDTCGTILHQAILKGDRMAFELLVHTFGANLNLPAPGGHLDMLYTHQANVYHLLARASHGDLWFAKQFLALGIKFDLPVDFTPWTASSYFPPLFQALFYRRWPYAQWLLQNGARLEQQIKPGRSVLSTCLAPEFVNRKLLEFLFPLHKRGGAFEYLPFHLNESLGFEVFQYFCESFRPFGLESKESQEWHDSKKLLDVETAAYNLNAEEQPSIGEHCNLRADCKCPSCREFFLRDFVWSKAYLRNRLNEHDARTSADLVTYFWEADNEAASPELWRKLPREAQCWSYLLDVYEDVTNSLVLYRSITIHLPLPKLMLASQWRIRCTWQWYTRSFSWPSRSPSLMTQSLSLGTYSYVIFALTVSYFQERAKQGRRGQAFPTQTWRDRLFDSPLSSMTAYERSQCVLSREYGYRRSADDLILRKLKVLGLALMLLLGDFVLYGVGTHMVDGYRWSYHPRRAVPFAVSFVTMMIGSGFCATLMFPLVSAIIDAIRLGDLEYGYYYSYTLCALLVIGGGASLVLGILRGYNDI